MNALRFRKPWNFLSQRSQPAAASKRLPLAGRRGKCTKGGSPPTLFALLPAIAVVSPGTGWGTMANDFPERRAQMFPRLSAEQIERLSKCGERRRVARGTILFDQGDTSRNFHVVISGEMEIVHPVDGREERITVHAPGQFTGESSLLTGRPALVRGRMREDGELLEVTPDALRRVVQSDSELSEILLRAFILRRVALIANDRGDAVLIGSSHSAATLKSATPPPVGPPSCPQGARASEISLRLDRSRREIACDEVDAALASSLSSGSLS